MDQPSGAAAAVTPVRSYGTRFVVAEKPLSEGGLWRNGRTDGVDWSDVVAAGGYAHGEVSRMTVAERRVEQGNLGSSGAASPPEGDYDDPTAVLGGLWGRNQHAVATVFCRNPTDAYFQEVQLRLRTTIQPHFCTGYEFFWRCLTGEHSYAEIVRWNGRIGDWVSLVRHKGRGYGVKHGDVVEATVIGSELKGYVNGVEVIAVGDKVFNDGAPGIGFNFFVGETNVDHGFSQFEVVTWDD